MILRRLEDDNPRGQYGAIVYRDCEVCHEQLDAEEGYQRGHEGKCDNCTAEDRAHDALMDEVAAVMDIYHEVTHPARTRGLEMGTL